MSKFLLFFLLPYAVFGQFTISGRILNHDDNQPASNVNVFLNNATIGSKTAADGIFILHNVKPGNYALIASSVGFSTFSEPVTITHGNILLPAIYLFPKTIALAEVKVSAGGDAEWQRNLALFESTFLGASGPAGECKLLNPEALDLNYDKATKILTAKSEDFLVVENKTLGYQIKYLLSDFSLNNYDENARRFFYEGYVLFKEMKGLPEQEDQWEKARRQTYANSVTHFLRAALKNTLGQEGFNVFRFLQNPQRQPDSIIYDRIKVYAALKGSEYRDSLAYWMKQSKLPKLLAKQAPVALTGDDLIKNTDKRGIYALGCDNCALYVTYKNKQRFSTGSLRHIYDQNNTSATLVTFNVPFAFFDGNGAITNPGCLTYTGVWANKRIADLLPVNYEPQQAGVLPDSTLVKKIDLTLKNYIADRPIEKAYLHFDKPYYAAGDTLYFKAYITNAAYELSAQGETLSVELVGPGNRIYSSVKLKLKDGTAAGDFTLADTLEKGFYRLRAYTNNMLAYSQEYFFDQPVFIINEPVHPNKKRHANGRMAQSGISQPKISSDKIDVQFFPEGGNLVNDVSSKIAFKATGPDGLGVDVKGTVNDEQGNRLGTFATSHLGMGTFALKPEAGKKYRASVTYGDTTMVFDLPQSDESGYAMNFDDTDSQSIRISIAAGQHNVQSQLYLIAQSGATLYFYLSGRLTNNHFETIVPKNLFPDGVIQFTLFSGNGEPMNERLVFIRHQGQLNLKVETGSQVYRPRQKVKITLLATDNEHLATQGNFSVSVTDETKMPVEEDDESTILTHLLLTSDLRGYVEKPNYYFSANNKAYADLDVLMLTQGYHRFEWKKILNQKFKPVALQTATMMAVSGKIKDLDGKPVAHGKVSLTSVSGRLFFLDTIADANGKFEFKHLPPIDSMSYMIQATDKKVREYSQIEIDKISPPDPRENKNAPEGNKKEPEGASAYLDFSNSFHQQQLAHGLVKGTIALRQVMIKEQREQPYLRHSSNLNGPGMANDVITADQLSPGCPTLLGCIAGRLHGINFVDGTPYYGGLNGHLETAVIIDGIEINGRIVIGGGKMSGGLTKADIINTLSVTDVASIEIITDAGLAAIYGVRGGGGLILINTKKWDDIAGSSAKPRFSYYSPVTYYKARVFYSPQYDVKKMSSSYTDLRSTIYWNPNITTKDGSAEFEFFNADTKGTYRVVIEGIDDKGHPGRQVYSYKVE